MSARRYAKLQARAKAVGMVVDVFVMYRYAMPGEGEVRAIPFRRVGRLDAPLSEGLDKIEAEILTRERRREDGQSPNLSKSWREASRQLMDSGDAEPYATDDV